jgi:hypothetical protein
MKNFLALASKCGVNRTGRAITGYITAILRWQRSASSWNLTIKDLDHLMLNRSIDNLRISTSQRHGNLSICTGIAN